jgi:hypothetical protein
MAQVDQIKAHVAAAEQALQNANKATASATRQSYALLASAYIQTANFIWSWPDQEAGYGPLP